MPTTVPAWVSIAATLLGGGILAYGVRQVWSGHKLKKALKAEIQSMKGLENCKNSMNSRKSPPSDKPLSPSDVPPAGSIPTTIYESNVGQLGLLRRKDLTDVVEFYSDVLRYKAIITAVRSGDDIPEPDQKDLYDSISSLEDRRQSLFGKDWMPDTEDDGTAVD
ncbi:hypothetical protein [Salinigranum sp. GCM10025319]|uniref:hypothetical protein n=1 Tax=Salinigranum sp. GCM10025319 TaxID=3252687 RepID=UPI0036186CEF